MPHLTPAQLTTLKTAILADPVLAAMPMNTDGDYDIATALNKLASPAFTVWATNVPMANMAKLNKAENNGVVNDENSNDMAVMTRNCMTIKIMTSKSFASAAVNVRVM